jgi:hypothetical protein
MTTQDQAPAPARLACPRCGAAMNRHAEKIDTRIAPDAGEDFEVFGGALCAVHTCSACRYVVSER